METKTCPGCSEDVPAEAARCKHCFHDFNAVQEKKTSPVLTLLALFAAMAVLGGGTAGAGIMVPGDPENLFGAGVGGTAGNCTPRPGRGGPGRRCRAPMLILS